MFYEQNKTLTTSVILQNKCSQVWRNKWEIFI